MLACGSRNREWEVELPLEESEEEEEQSVEASVQCSRDCNRRLCGVMVTRTTIMGAMAAIITTTA